MGLPPAPIQARWGTYILIWQVPLHEYVTLKILPQWPKTGWSFHMNYIIAPETKDIVLVLCFEFKWQSYVICTNQGQFVAQLSDFSQECVMEKVGTHGLSSWNCIMPWCLFCVTCYSRDLHLGVRLVILDCMSFSARLCTCNSMCRYKHLILSFIAIRGEYT